MEISCAQSFEEHSTSMLMLHGDMELTIFDAQNLPTNFRRHLPKFRLCKADSPYNSNKFQGKSRGTYVSVYLGGARIVRTQPIAWSENPVWNQTFRFPVAHLVSQIDFIVKDNYVLLPKLVGTTYVPAELVARGDTLNQTFQIFGPHIDPEAAIGLKITYIPYLNNPLYQHGFSNNYQVKQSYFPLRLGGRMTLYQDAHTVEESVQVDGNIHFEHGKCWKEICNAIIEARHLVYIVGWSIYTKVVLVREPTNQGSDDEKLTLGELLKKKSRLGVRVAMLVWNDLTSRVGVSAGVMKTHDKETQSFFKHSSVKCLLAPRYTNSTFANLKEQTRRALYTQHQKCVIVDTQGDGTNRKLTAFVGGLDLCGGRYDTPEHRLYRDQNTVFKDDYFNVSYKSRETFPRQPWHDLHCKLEGPAAYDVLTNFEQRWRKASEWAEMGREFKRTLGWEDDVLLDIEQIPWITSPTPAIPKDHPSLWVSNEDDSENWNTQVFRSIDSGSLEGFPEDADSTYKQNLVLDKNLVFDRSIEMAYIQAIRTAQHFIYIENQYFIGSSFAWPSDQVAGANNLIPMELALKIASKIRAKERFAVYIVIPMWPEGLPYSMSVQEILYWQRQTMKMMYEVVARELQASHLENVHPTDYLNFYCLGNREQFQAREDGSSTSAQSSSHGNIDRFMIYVHSKGMIVDDEYVIIGSANINQRSLAGSRDTEIAVGAYQPHYTASTTKERPHGQVYGYRISLWEEHIGTVDNCFKVPESLDCIKYVNNIAESNWNRYTTEEFTPLQGHILKYPVQIDINGHVSALPGSELFPGFDGQIEGARSGILPCQLTT